MDMQRVKEAKAFLKTSTFKNLNGDILTDDQILYPCG